MKSAGMPFKIVFLTLGLILFCDIWFRLLVVGSTEFSTLISLSFLMNGILSGVLFSTAISRDGISFRVIFWFFHFLFFFLVPYAQYLGNRWMFLSDSSLLSYANFTIFIWLCLFQSSYFYFRSRASIKEHLNTPSNYSYNFDYRDNNGLLSIVSIVVLISCFFLSRTSLESILLRGQAGVVNAVGGWGPIGLISQYYFRPLSFFTFFFLIHFSKKSSRKKKAYFVLSTILCSISAIIFNFPTGVARFYAFAIGLSAVIYFVRPGPRKSSFYLILLVVSTMVSPIIGSFRHNDSLSDLGSLSIKLDLESFFSGGFDAYENFIHAISYVDLNGITWGNQLLGVLFFWVPRSIWSNKPIGTGAFIAQDYLSTQYVVHNTNLSAPLIEELYINFHLPAVILGAIILGFLLGRGDRYFLNSNLTNLTRAVASLDHILLYPVLIGLLLFILRGDALSSFAYTCGIFLSYLTVKNFLYPE